MCVFRTLTRSSHVCVCVCFSSLFHLHNLALDFIIFAIFNGVFVRSLSSASGTIEYVIGLGEPLRVLNIINYKKMCGKTKKMLLTRGIGVRVGINKLVSSEMPDVCGGRTMNAAVTKNEGR